MECRWIGWCAHRPEAQAGSVQAVGSILAIIAPLSVVRTKLASEETSGDALRATLEKR